jgi:hypothetical protein
MLRFFDGFDSYATADLPLLYNIVGTTGGSSFTIAAGQGRFSSGALKNSVSGGNEQVTRFFDDQPTWVVGVAFKFATGGVATSLIEISTGSGPQVELRMTSSNLLQVTSDGGVHVLGTGTTTLLTNTFYYIEFKVTISTSISANTCKARLGGTDEIVVATSSSTDPQATGTASRVALRYDAASVVITWDDLYILDGTGSANNDFLGDMRVEDLRPNAQGHYSDYSVTGAGTHYGAVNETDEDGDTSYVSSSTVGNKETYTFPNLSSTPTAIAGIQLVSVARKDDAGSRAITPMFRAGGTDYSGTQLPLPDSYGYLIQINETNPATSAAWTGSDVNAIEAGFETTQ